MMLAGRQDLHRRMIEPSADRSDTVLGPQRVIENFAMGRDADESQDGDPRQAHRTQPRQRPFPPLTSDRVLRRIGIVRVEQDVYIGNDHELSRAILRTKSSTSSSSTS